MKTCSRCGHTGPDEDFPPKRLRCKPCRADDQRVWNTANPDKRKAAHRREQEHPERPMRALRRRARVLGLDPELVVGYLLDHDGLCEICGRPEPVEGKSLSIDHDHKTGAFRGVLCSNCNNGLGRFADRIDLLESAMTYLKSSPGDLGKLLGA